MEWVLLKTAFGKLLRLFLQMFGQYLFPLASPKCHIPSSQTIHIFSNSSRISSIILAHRIISSAIVATLNQSTENSFERSFGLNSVHLLPPILCLILKLAFGKFPKFLPQIFGHASHPFASLKYHIPSSQTIPTSASPFSIQSNWLW